MADLVAGIVINKLSVRFEELDSKVGQMHSKVGQMDSKVGQIADSIGHVVSDMLDPWRIIHTEDGSEREGESLKSTILKYYNIEARDCMIVGNVHRQDSAITNAHLWPNHTKGKGLTLFGLDTDEVANPRNFLRLQKQIEHAFDHQQIVFDPVFESSSSFRLKIVVLDGELLKNKSTLFRTVLLKSGRRKARRVHVDFTWEKLNGFMSNYTFSSALKPFTRVILHHYVQSHIFAASRGWIVPQDIPPSRLHALELARNSLDAKAHADFTFMLNHL